jgi:hypothetical protein
VRRSSPRSSVRDGASSAESGSSSRSRRGLGRERAGEGHPLALAAGELAGAAAEEVREAEPLRERPDPRVPLRARERPEPVADVGRHREVREERVVLEEQAHPPALRRHEGPVGAVEPGLAVEADEAAVRAIEAGDGAEHRGLAGAGGPEEHGHGARRRIERERGGRLDHRAAVEPPLDVEAQRPFHRKNGRRWRA